MWALVMFDLPTLTKADRRAASAYRKMLLEFGFSQVQLSVYSKYFINATGLRTILVPIKHSIPPGGAVRLLQLTDTQWGVQYRFFGPEGVKPEFVPQMLDIFED